MNFGYPFSTAILRALDFGLWTLDFNFENVPPVPSPIAIRTPYEHVTQKLHLDLLKTRAATAFALSLCGIETESAGIQAALFRHVGLREQFADVLVRANINRGV